VRIPLGVSIHEHVPRIPLGLVQVAAKVKVHFLLERLHLGRLGGRWIRWIAPPAPLGQRDADTPALRRVRPLHARESK
jgi:hypothetical protein